MAELTLIERNQLIIDTIDLDCDKQSYVYSCPRCRIKGSFSVLKEPNIIYYNCFRDACGVHGVIRTIPNKPLALPAPKKDKPKNTVLYPHADKLISIPKTIKQELSRKYQFSKALVRRNELLYEEDNNRICIPINNYYGMKVGKILRKTDSTPNGLPKSSTYWERPDNVRLYFPIMRNYLDDKGSIVVVEDPYSAMKIANFMPACALLGTHMNMTQAAFLASKYKTMYILLDRDALESARNISQKYCGLFNHVALRFLPQDPKDTDLIILENILKGKEYKGD